MARTFVTETQESEEDLSHFSENSEPVEPGFDFYNSESSLDDRGRRKKRDLLKLKLSAFGLITLLSSSSLLSPPPPPGEKFIYNDDAVSDTSPPKLQHNLYLQQK